MISVPVPLGDRSYDVLVGRGARHRLLDVLPVGASRAAVVTQERIGLPVDPGVQHRTFFIGEGEDAKNLETVEQLCREFARWGLHRNDVVVAVGGGVVTDTAGFAAAVYHRGVAAVHVATTLLAQVDAAIGGKTGVNLPEGKNLVGAFWQPAAVLCDTEALETLPAEEYRSGLGEVAKYHFLDPRSGHGGPGRDARRGLAPALWGGEGLADLAMDEKVARCVEIKAAVVSADEKEGGLRATLNYGHTLAHALETAGDYEGLRHGEAVAIGLTFAAELAHRLGRIDEARVKEHRAVLEGYGLPTQLPPGSDADLLLTLMGRDKKALAGLTFVLDGSAGVEVVRGVGEHEVRAALESVA